MDVINVTEGAETFTCNAFLVLGERTVLVDAGAMSGVSSVIREHTDDLDAVILTHQHGDHIAQLDAVLETFDVEVHSYMDHPQATHSLEHNATITVGDEPCEVIHTPGHAKDHISLVSETSLFAGDVVVHDDGAFDYGSFGRTDMPGQSREQLIESIQTLYDRLPATVEHLYAGHGSVFHGDVPDLVATALERAEAREPKYPQ
jgi:glyoxylase-like metal-dependent hydrolase (beta-lactamase superfamily II)